MMILYSVYMVVSFIAKIVMLALLLYGVMKALDYFSSHKKSNDD